MVAIIIKLYDFHALMKINLIYMGFEKVFKEDGLIQLAFRAHSIKPWKYHQINLV